MDTSLRLTRGLKHIYVERVSGEKKPLVESRLHVKLSVNQCIRDEKMEYRRQRRGMESRGRGRQSEGREARREESKRAEKKQQEGKHT